MNDRLVPPTPPAAEERFERFRDENAGISFDYSATFGGKKTDVAKASATATSTRLGSVVVGISYVDDQGATFLGQDFEVFKKPVQESIETSIANILVKLGKKPADCRIVSTSLWSTEDAVTVSGTLAYAIELARPAVLTAEERAAIAKREKDYAVERDGFMDAAYLKRQFENDHLVALCSIYAFNPVGLTGSKSVRGVFYYRPAAPGRFVYAAALYDPRLYKNLEILP